MTSQSFRIEEKNRSRLLYSVNPHRTGNREPRITPVLLIPCQHVCERTGCDDGREMTWRTYKLNASSTPPRVPFENRQFVDLSSIPAYEVYDRMCGILTTWTFHSAILREVVKSSRTGVEPSESCDTVTPPQPARNEDVFTGEHSRRKGIQATRYGVPSGTRI
ncbi:hypothetical protein RRG08_036702 [Elysia crispata]|uniref:Uncharacterized protein n=1 Tax=Elysia crispata TaxID=231223 RepID=A0AAE0XVL6_9GAST|nr:hypothetical protein RRG08_036702 [Elysia crispata]